MLYGVNIISSEDKMTDKGIKIIVCGIARHLQGLERFELNFCK